MVCPLTLTPQEAGMEPYGGSLERTEDTASASSIHMIHKSAVLLLVLYTFLSAFTSALPQHFPGIADAYGLAGTGAFMISVCMIMNSAGKVLLGMTIDKLGARRSIDLFALLVFAGAFLIANVPVKGVLLGASALYGLTYSIETVGPASITREVFGSENYEKVYPKCALASTTANAAGTTLIGVMYDAGGNYESTMILILAALVLSLVSLHFIYRKGIGKQS
jgi:MFS family permease